MTTPYGPNHQTKKPLPITEWDRYMKWFDPGWSLSLCDENFDKSWVVCRGGKVASEYDGGRSLL